MGIGIGLFGDYRIMTSLNKRDQDFKVLMKLAISTQDSVEVNYATTQLLGSYADDYVLSGAWVAAKEKSTLEKGVDDKKKMLYGMTPQGHELLDFVGGPNFKHNLQERRSQNPD